MRIQRDLPPELPMLASDNYQVSPATPVPTHLTQGGLSFAQIFSIFRAHLRMSIMIAVSLIILTAVVVKLLPKNYAATATVLVNYEANDPTRQVPAELFASYMLTQVELIQSRDLLVNVINKMGLVDDPEFAPKTTTGLATPLDFAERNVRSNLTIEQGKGIELLYVTFTSKDRDKAAAIANAIVETYETRERDRVTDPGGGRAYEYSEKLKELKTKVDVAQGNMADFRQRTGLADVSSQNDVETQTLTGLQQQLLVAQNTRREAESKTGGDQSVSTSVLGSALIQNLKNQLATQQSQLAQLSATLGPQHPKVMELQEQIAATRRSLSTEVQTFKSGGTEDVASAKQVEERAQRAVEEQRTRLVSVRKLQDEGQRLQLELESAQSVYKRALDGYDQIMFASASTVTHAKAPIESTKPPKMALFIGGIFLALVIGALGPLGYEVLLNRRLRCRDDVERDFGLPVLAEFDRVAGLI